MPRRARILTVDDEPEILSALTEFLTVQGYEAVAAQSAQEAFMWRSLPPTSSCSTSTCQSWTG
jgi:DNA-binding response OmpR family regulator